MLWLTAVAFPRKTNVEHQKFRIIYPAYRQKESFKMFPPFDNRTRDELKLKEDFSFFKRPFHVRSFFIVNKTK